MEDPMKKFLLTLVSVIKAPGPEVELSCKRAAAMACIIAGIAYAFIVTPDPAILGILFGEAGVLLGVGAITKS